MIKYPLYPGRGPYGRACYFDTNMFQAGAINFQGDWIACIENGNQGFNIVHAVDTLYAVPFVSPPLPVKVRSIAAAVSGAVALSELRIGIYQNVADPRDLYPGALLFGSEVLSGVAAGVKRSACPDINLRPGEVYWMALLMNATLGMRSLPSGSAHILGCDPADFTVTGKHTQITVAQAYGALPASYPGGGAYSTAQQACLRCNFG